MFLSLHRLLLLARFSKRPSLCLAVSNSLRKKLSRACCEMPSLGGIKIAKSAGAERIFLATPHRGELVLTGGILKSKCRVPQRRATARAVASWMWVGAAMPRVWSQLCTVSQQSERVHVRGSRKIIRKAPRSLSECSAPS